MERKMFKTLVKQTENIPGQETICDVDEQRLYIFNFLISKNEKYFRDMNLLKLIEYSLCNDGDILSLNFGDKIVIDINSDSTLISVSDDEYSFEFYCHKEGSIHLIQFRHTRFGQYMDGIQFGHEGKNSWIMYKYGISEKEMILGYRGRILLLSDEEDKEDKSNLVREYILARKYYYRWISISSKPPYGKLFLYDWKQYQQLTI